MPANLWELRSDVLPLEVAAQRWSEIATLMARRGDEIVDAAVRATEGWDAAAAESYDHHRRQVLANLDRFTTLASQISGSLRAVASIITSSQKELDLAWTKVEMIPHEVVGDSRYLVFKPEADDDRTKVTAGQEEAEEIRRRLTLSLDQESTRLRSARSEFIMVRTELQTIGGGTFAGGIERGTEESGVGTVPIPSTSVPGSAQGGGGAAGLPPIGPISFEMPHLTGISAAGLAPFIATAAGAAAPGLRGGRRTSPAGTAPMGGMGAGGMAARAGTMSRGMAGGRSGSQRLATPKLQGQAESEAALSATDKDAAKQAAKEAKRAELEQKRAERAARRAEREAEKQDQDRVPEAEVDEAEEGEHDDAPDADREADGGGADR
ncbi:hypothetical protein J2X46_000982 [Nocardioides sp. BE266]|uniref:hypothetical protein n=1 Tax=Nocardioides sp. BE266 TaxID=2817725 RepID=UPI00285DD9AF|nr:hypothetical protein [Nocardioides sp. BE266]MDR7252006.1 hypothetical protein [Nocardioides sp. BE266]